MSALRVLIIGGGAIAGGYDAGLPDEAWPRTHAAAYRRAGGFELAAVVEPDEARREAFVHRWGVAEGFATVEQSMRTAPFDIISICSPTAFHANDLARAISIKPRLIFCEKPVTPSLGETRALVSQASTAGVAIAVNHTRRWAPDMVSFRRDLSSGKFGRVRSVQAIYNKGVLNNGTHLFDMLGMLFGRIRLLAAGRSIADYVTTDPSIPFLAETDDGIPISVAVGDARDFSLFELSVVTQSGVVQIEDGGGHWRSRHVVDSPDFPGYRALDRGGSRAGRYEEAMTAAVVEIREWAAGGSPLSSTGETAIAAQALSETALMLSRRLSSGEPQNTQETRP